MPRFICILSPGSADSPAADSNILAEHGAYLQGLHREGVLVAAGPIDSPTAGLVVYDADNSDHALEIALADPIVERGGHIAQVRERTVAIGA